MEESFFKSEEFRLLLKKYEEMQKYSISSYFSADELLEIASYYLYKNMQPEAENVISYALDTYPSDQLIKEAEIRALLSRGDIQKAQDKLKEISFIDTPELQLLKTEIELAAGNNNSISDLNNIIKGTNLRDDLALNTLDVMIKGGFTAEALHWIEKGLRHYPSHIPLLEAKADCLIEQRHMQEALSLYNRLLDNDPYNYFYWEQLGYIYYVTERYGKALECFEYELTTNEEAEYAKMMQAFCYYYLQDYIKAYKSFCELTKAYPGNVISTFFSALSLCGLGNYSTAIKILDSLLVSGELTDIETFITEINKSLILDKAGYKDISAKILEHALKYDIEDINLLALHGNGYIEIHDKESLLQKHIELIEREPRNRDEILLEFALYIYDYGREEPAINVLKYTREQMYDSADIDAFLAFMLWKSGQKEESSPYIQSAINGKSNKLFELFGFKYDPNIDCDKFIERIGTIRQ